MDFLLLSLFALGVGPLLVTWAHRARATTIAIDAFAVVVIGGFVLLHILPEAVAEVGWTALLAALLGFVVPLLAERGLSFGRRSMRWTVIALALMGMAVHAVMDGMAVGVPHAIVHGDHVHEQSADLLAWAVILHRIPVGVGIWWIVPRTLGRPIAVATLAVTALATIIGFAIGREALTEASAHGLALFQALLSGSLLHVVLHAHVPPPPGVRAPRWHFASALGTLAACVVLWVVVHDHFPRTTIGGQERGPGWVFVTLALESAPALLLAYLMVGLSHALMPASWLQRITRGKPFTQALRGVAVGLPLPVCSCGVVPIYRELVIKGASIAAAIAFLIATPELEIAAVLLTWQLMGPELAIARLVCAAALALGVGMLLGVLVKRVAPAAPPPEDPEATPSERRSVGQVLRTALHFGYGDAVDNTASWILIGLGLSAMLLPFVDPQWVASLPAGIDVPAAALLGMPLYVCATGSTPLAAILLVQGLSPGAVLAFLLTGPATNITTFGLVARLNGKRVALLFTLSMLVGTIALGYLVNLALPQLRVPLHLETEHAHSPLQWLCLYALAGVFLVSLLRQGVRTFIERLFESPAYADSHCH